MSLVYFGKCKGEDVTMALGCLLVFLEGLILGFVGKHTQYSLKLGFVALSGVN